MPDYVPMEVRYLAPVAAVPPRARTGRTYWVPMVSTVMIPSVTAAEAPVVLKVQCRREKIVRRLFGGQVIGPLGLEYDSNGYSEEVLRERLGDHSRSGRCLFDGAEPWEWKRRAEDYPHGAAIVDDGRAAMARRVEEAAGTLCLLDGIGQSRAAVPALCLMDSGGGDVEPTVTTDMETGYVFDLDRLDAMRAFVQANTGPGLFRRCHTMMPSVEVLDPDLTGLAEDAYNARYAIVSAIYSVKDRLPWMPNGMFRHLAELSVMRDGVVEGAVSPHEVDESLAGLAAMGTAMQSPSHLLRAVQLGRAAIAASRPGKGVGLPMDETDAMALADI